MSGSARLDAAGGGTLSFVTGVSSRATGDVQFATCGASSGAAGTASLAVGASGSGAGGQVTLEAGRSGTSPGEITFSTGHSGDLSVTTADTSRTDGYSGSVFIKSGDSASSGEISIETGSTPQTSGSIALDTGATYHRAGADVAIESGTGHPGGDIKLEAGNASSSLWDRAVLLLCKVPQRKRWALAALFAYRVATQKTHPSTTTIPTGTGEISLVTCFLRQKFRSQRTEWLSGGGHW